MAGGGVGEAMLIGAAVGAGTGGIMSAAQDKDPLEGALLGAAMGAAGGGIGSGIGGLASGGAQAGTQAAVQTGTQAAGSAGAAGVSSGAGSQAATLAAQNAGMGMTAAEQTAALLGTTNAQAGSQAATLAAQNAGMGLNAAESAANIISSTTPGTTSFAGAAPTSWGAQGLGQGMAPALTNAQAYGAGAGGGIMGLIGNAQNQGEQWAPEQEPYSGSLSYFKYNPQTFRPSVAPGYADGGVASLQPTAMYPQSQLDTTQFAVPSQRPASREVVNADYDARINPYTGDMMMASGGISSLGSYSDGGRMLRGPGDGMSDDIPGVIAGKQPARLADGEFVVPADVVSHLGNGSTDAGAKKLYSMMDNVRKARTGSKKQGKQIKAEKHMPGMKSGGIAYYDEGGTTSDPMPQWFSDYLAQQQAQPRAGMGDVSGNFQPSGFSGSERQYSPYTMANRPSSTEPQYYQDIYRGWSPDYSTPGYTLTGGNLGRWSNVAGEAQRAAQPASMSQQATQSYLQNLGRAPDQSGFNYWMGSGMSAPQINKAIAGSDEALNRAPGDPNKSNPFINRLYDQYLNRGAEEGGLSYWQNQLAQGDMSAQQVRDAIINSPEAHQYEQNYITDLYKQYLGRSPDEEGLNYWRQQQQGTTNQQKILEQIKNSPEAQAYAAQQKAPEKPAEVEKKRRGGIASLV